MQVVQAEQELHEGNIETITAHCLRLMYSMLHEYERKCNVDGNSEITVKMSIEIV